MSEVKPIKNLAKRTDEIRKSLGKLARAYDNWQLAVKNQDNSRNYAQNTYKNIASDVGADAADILSVIDQLIQQSAKSNEAAMKERDLRLEAEEKLTTGTPKSSKVKTAVIEPEDAEK